MFNKDNNMSIIRWSPWDMGEVDELFNRLPSNNSLSKAFVPALDMYETDKDVVIETTLPGLNPEDVKVSVEKSILTLQGESKKEHEEKSVSPKPSLAVPNDQAIKKKLSYLEQKEWETIEDEIATLEEKIEALTKEMNHQGSDFTQLQKIQKEIDQTEEQLDEKMTRWEYLSEWAD